jgi:hypothetical protein
VRLVAPAHEAAPSSEERVMQDAMGWNSATVRYLETSVAKLIQKTRSKRS